MHNFLVRVWLQSHGRSVSVRYCTQILRKHRFRLLREAPEGMSHQSPQNWNSHFPAGAYADAHLTFPAESPVIPVPQNNYAAAQSADARPASLPLQFQVPLPSPQFLPHSRFLPVCRFPDCLREYTTADPGLFSQTKSQPLSDRGIYVHLHSDNPPEAGSWKAESARWPAPHRCEIMFPSPAAWMQPHPAVRSFQSRYFPS